MLHHRDELSRREVVDVSIRGSQGGMTQLALDDRNGHSLHHQLIGMGVTQPMRVDTFFNASILGEAGQEATNVGGLPRTPKAGAKQRDVTDARCLVGAFRPTAPGQLEQRAL